MSGSIAEVRVLGGGNLILLPRFWRFVSSLKPKLVSCIILI